MKPSSKTCRQMTMNKPCRTCRQVDSMSSGSLNYAIDELILIKDKNSKVIFKSLIMCERGL